MADNNESASEQADEQTKPPLTRLRSNSYDKAVSGDQPDVKKTSSPEPTSDNGRKDNIIYIVKWIEFNHQRLPILLQNVNGPCPLLAIANILLLRKKVNIRSRFLIERIISNLDWSQSKCRYN